MPWLASLRVLALSVLITSLLAIVGVTAASAERVALVIGNSEYNTNPLINPENDAMDMAARLSELGYRVHGDGPLLQQTLREMQVAIRDFTRSLNPGDLAVFYFAGHGVEYKGTNYLVPVDDEEIAFAEDVPDWAYPAPRLLERLAATGATGVIILDACRNNPLPSRGADRDLGVGLSSMEAPPGASAFIMYAAAPGQTSSDGEGRNGLFTEALLDALERPSRRIDDIMYQVSFSVRTATDGRQVPWLEMAFAGEIPPHFQRGGERADSNEVPVQVALSVPDGGKPGRGIREEGRALYGAIEVEDTLPTEGIVFDLLAGGYEDASQLGGTCFGFVASNPDLTLSLEAPVGRLHISSRSDDPTVLVLRAPNGDWICVGPEEDSTELALAAPEVGLYRLWVGTETETAHAPDATLLFHSGIAATRPADPERPADPAGEDSAANDISGNPAVTLDRSLNGDAPEGGPATE